MTKAKKYLIGCAVVLPIGACLVGIIGIQLVQKNADSQLARDLAKLRKAGIATEAGQLRRWKPADKDNAASIYRSVTEEIGNDRSLGEAARKVEDAMVPRATPAAIRDAELAYPLLRASIAQIETAADLPYCDFNYKYGNALAVEFGDFAAMKSSAKLLRFKARRQTQAGDDAGALRTLHRIRRIASHAGEEPGLIGMLVARSIDGIAWSASVQVLKAAGATPESIRQVRIFANSAPPIRPFRYYMEGEFVVMLSTIRGLKRLEDLQELADNAVWPDGPEEAERRTAPSPWNIEAARSIALQSYVAPYAHVLPSMSTDPRAWKQAKKDIKRMAELAHRDRSPLNFINPIIIPTFEKALEPYSRYYTNYILLDTTLNLLEARNRGGLPSKLPPGETSLDPFTDRPLRYVRKGKGLLLYSVGPNRKDDGGSRVKEADDVSIEFP